MATEIRSALHRSSATLLEDALGVASLVVMLLGALYLPGFF